MDRRFAQLSQGLPAYFKLRSLSKITTVVGGFSSFTGNKNGSVTFVLQPNADLSLPSISLYSGPNSIQTVKYDGNGATSGNVPINRTIYKLGSPVSVIGNTGALSKTGYTFAGWNTQANGMGTDYAPGSTFTMGTLYAKWTSYTVTYNGNGSTGGSVPVDSGSYMQGVTATVYGNTGNLVKTGYTFAGWNTKADGSGTRYAGDGTATFTLGAANVTLYAMWNPLYTVTYNGNGATSGSVPTDSSSYLQGVIATVYGNTGSLVKTGYAFAGWNTAADGSGTSYAPGASFPMGATNVTLYAQWQSANALLSNLSVDQGTLTQISIINYSVSVPYTVSSLNISLTKGDPNQTLTVTGATYSSVTGNVYAYNASNLIVGSNPIQIVVSAQNHTQNTYSLTVNRASAPTPAPTPSSNVDLSGLTLSSGSLTPAFASGTTAYTSSVANSVSSITVTASVYDSNATMTVNGAADASGQASGAINLNVGSNLITIVVTAQNGTPKTYTVTVTRAPAPSSGGGGSSSTSSSNTVTSTDGTLMLSVGKSGEVSLGDAIKILIPADASGKDLKLTIDKVADTQKLITSKDVLASPVFEILKNFSENFSKDITLTFAFDPNSLKGHQKPSVFYYDESNQVWVEVGGEVTGNTITVKVNHFTKYAVFGVGQGADSTTDTKQTISFSFSDISGNWAEATIKQAVSGGIVSGYPDGTFKPERTVTRAEVAVMLMNALKPQGDGAALTFTDKAKIGDWAQKSVAQAVYAGIINGYEDGSFRPDAEITRPEMAMMIAKALGQSSGAATATGFTDDKDIPDWAKGAVADMKKAGIIEGKGANQFAPGDKTTRAEAVTVLLKMQAQKNK
ncbi:S-layer homology domain-containing protein [Paenibacillus filicis]|uniref:S-layer homology domain-containing protein n=1 Tax=Paenibacillus gyeongsangnamensis TaxID=3388067 RepID=A0ABT4QGN9_9BACL|nr:S-layer homology domain-containing protein [Paenibacillus filicis]MCZ8516017.1 S-layer homology domain-containing protein [Paenibacillus filicis]